MIPHPPWSFSSRRRGKGFQMSNTRKSIKPSKRYFQFTRLSAKKIAKTEKSMCAVKCGSAMGTSGSRRARGCRPGSTPDSNRRKKDEEGQGTEHRQGQDGVVNVAARNEKVVIR